jgi:hypothetical protein
MKVLLTNPSGELRGAGTAEIFGHVERLHALVHELFPKKPAAHLADLTGLSVRAWHKSLRDRRNFSTAALLFLFRSRHGPAFLHAFIGDDCRERWFVEFQIMWRRVEIEQWERDLRGIDDDIAASTAARRHQGNGAPRQMGAPPGGRKP